MFRESSREAQEPVTEALVYRGKVEKRRKENKGAGTTTEGVEVNEQRDLNSEVPSRRERVERSPNGTNVHTERKEGGTSGKRKVESLLEGYVWVLSRHIPFYHASGLRCPRSRCQENGRIFPLRAHHERGSRWIKRDRD